MVSQAVEGVHCASFPVVLIDLVRRCAREHPFRLLPTVLALANSSADQAEMNQSSKKGASASSTDSEGEDDRTVTAKLLLRKLSKASYQDPHMNFHERTGIIP